MKIVKFFLGFLIICLFTMFATANLQKVNLNFLTEGQSLIGYNEIQADGETQERKAKEIPVFLLVFASFGTGFVVSWFLNIGIIQSMKRKMKLLKREYSKQDMELNNLRNLPVSNSEVSETTESSLPIPNDVN